MSKTLKQHFPMIRDRLELQMEIESNPDLKAVFESWIPERQKEFLDICTGVRGMKFLYDSFFKEILNPEYTPERLESLLSILLREDVTILETLPADSTRIADETSLLIMDIVVRLSDGTIVNLEVQKIGYRFPGARSACYSADLLLRQYKRSRSEQKRLNKNFNYKNIKGVYTIIFFEHSPTSFHEFPDSYLHYFEQVSDTGLRLDLLQKYLFIPLDIFKEKQQNKDKKIEGILEAWLTFLSEDDPEKILHLIETYPQFKAMYEDAYSLCLNVEEVMQMFSKELAELDRNTVQLMIDEMEEELEGKRKELEGASKELESASKELESASKELESKSKELESKSKELEGLRLKEVEMITRIYHSVQDIKKAAEMLGIPEQEVKEAVEYAK